MPHMHYASHIIRRDGTNDKYSALCGATGYTPMSVYECKVTCKKCNTILQKYREYLQSIAQKGRKE